MPDEKTKVFSGAKAVFKFEGKTVAMGAVQPMPLPSTQGIFKHDFTSEFKYMSDSHFSESVSDPQTDPRSEVISRTPTHDWWSTTPTPVEPVEPAPPPTYRNPQGATVTCPWCDSGKVEAEFVDVGVGHQQVTGHNCFTCGASEISPHRSSHEVITETEEKLGWYGPDEHFLWEGWDKCPIEGCMETHICDAHKLKLWGAS